MDPQSNLPNQNSQPNPGPTPPLPPQQNETPELNTPQPAYVQPVQPTQPIAQPTPNPYQPIVSDSPAAPEFSAQTPPPQPVQPPKRSKAKLFGAVFAASLLLLMLGGFVFGYYLPNRPENVWKTSVNRSGQALTSLTNSSTEQSKIDALRKSDINLNVEATVGGQSYGGDLSVVFDDTKANGKLLFNNKSEDSAEINIAADFITSVAEGERFPDTFFRLNGLEDLVALQILPPELATYNNKWIAVESSYLASTFGDLPEAKETSDTELSSQEITEIVKAVTSTTTDRIFSTEPDKAVMINRGFVGREDVDGKSTFHYQVSVNKNNLKAYCAALVENVTSTAGYKKAVQTDDAGVEKQKEAALKGCNDDSQYDFEDDDMFDVWVDTSTKLIYKVRFTDEERPNTYFEIGQNYSGGDEIAIFVKYFSGEDQTEGLFTLTENSATNSSKGEVVYESKKADNPYKVSVKLEAKPFEGEVDVTPPKPTIPIQEVFKKLRLL